jgi:hypothetical protein
MASRHIEVKLKNGKTLFFRAQYPTTELDSETNGATEEALALLKQLPADLLATPPRALYDR